MRINEFTPDSRIFEAMKGSDSSKVKDEAKSERLSFADTLKAKLDEVNEQQLQAENITENFIKGDNVDIHQVMLVTEEAKLSLQMAVQIRNKLVEAYQELNRMQL